MKKFFARCLPAYQAVVYALGMLLATGLITGWGNWYFSNPHHRQQVDSLLQGKLALSESPADLAFDLAWSEGGVHQVWGLGVPLWRLPFVALGRFCGFPDFPDAFAFGIALAITGYCVIRTFSHPLGTVGEAVNRNVWIDRLSAFGAIVLLLLFPPFVNLLQTGFRVYEEVVAYEHLFGVVSLCGLISLVRNPGARRYILLCLWGGMGGLLRPTLVFYGMATVIAGTIILLAHTRRNRGLAGIAPALRQCWRPCAVGILAFCLGGTLLFATNLLRFGNGFEFGHKLNLQQLTSLSYTTRFTAPYEREPILSATKEMFGVLFLAKETSRGNYHRENIFPGQSATVRWRDLYFATFDLSYFILLLLGLLAGTLALHRCLVTTASEPPENSLAAQVVIFVTLWACLALVPLFGFYLRSPLISSRYLLDFMPAFVALTLAAWLHWINFCRSLRQAPLWTIISAYILFNWLFYQIYFMRGANGPPRVITWSEMETKKNLRKENVLKPLPAAYRLPENPMDYGIPYNGSGWNHMTGAVKPGIILFVESPTMIELEIAPGTATTSKEDLQQIKAKIGLELLDLQHVKTSGKGWTVQFRGPKNSSYEKGLQPLFIAFVPDPGLASETSPFILQSVRWR
ncbi:MAG: hypothetical protein ACO1QS_13390 [Verrucomicrobiota bacterium]